MSFRELGLSAELCDTLAHLGYAEPTPIQRKAIPPLLAGRDVIGQAKTGTGKTAAFGLPLLAEVDSNLADVQALVLCPTRELCIQVTQAIRAYGQGLSTEVVAVFGGAPIRDQSARLARGAQVVVGTVGRVLDLITRNALILDATRFVVLDEADEMLDLGFLHDVEAILARCPAGRQTALFSATIAPEIERLARSRMYDPFTIEAPSQTLTIEGVRQQFVEVAEGRKPEVLASLLRTEEPDQAIVFVRTKVRADRLVSELTDQGVRVRALHGDMTQGARDGIMVAFKDGRERLLVATDIAARGLDITAVSHVINFDLPTSPDVYVHRVGRTGRVGRSGTAITLTTHAQRNEISALARHAGCEISAWQAPAPASDRSDGAGKTVATNGARSPRHTKPTGGGSGKRYAKLVLNGGTSHGIGPAQVVRAIVERSHLEGASIRNVRALERFTLVEVPAEEAFQLAQQLTGEAIAGKVLAAEIARS